MQLNKSDIILSFFEIFFYFPFGVFVCVCVCRFVPVCVESLWGWQSANGRLGNVWFVTSINETFCHIFLVLQMSCFSWRNLIGDDFLVLHRQNLTFCFFLFFVCKNLRRLKKNSNKKCSLKLITEEQFLKEIPQLLDEKNGGSFCNLIHWPTALCTLEGSSVYF